MSRLANTTREKLIGGHLLVAQVYNPHSPRRRAPVRPPSHSFLPCFSFSLSMSLRFDSPPMPMPAQVVDMANEELSTLAVKRTLTSSACSPLHWIRSLYNSRCWIWSPLPVRTSGNPWRRWIKPLTPLTACTGSRFFWFLKLIVVAWVTDMRYR